MWWFVWLRFQTNHHRQSWHQGGVGGVVKVLRVSGLGAHVTTNHCMFHSPPLLQTFILPVLLLQDVVHTPEHLCSRGQCHRPCGLHLGAGPPHLQVSLLWCSQPHCHEAKDRNRAVARQEGMCLQAIPGGQPGRCIWFTPLTHPPACVAPSAGVVSCHKWTPFCSPAPPAPPHASAYPSQDGGQWGVVHCAAPRVPGHTPGELHAAAGGRRGGPHHPVHHHGGSPEGKEEGQGEEGSNRLAYECARGLCGEGEAAGDGAVAVSFGGL